MNKPHPSGDDHYTRRRPELIRRGTQAPGAKLTEDEIGLMCLAFDAGSSQAHLARVFKVSRMTVWRHLKARGYP